MRDIGKSIHYVLLIALLAAPCLANVPSEYTISRGTCDGAETDFAFSFKIGSDSELKVKVRDISTSEETALAEDTHYTVSVPNNDYTNMTGGTITTISAPTGFTHPFASGYEIVMYWRPALTQTYQPSRSSNINRRSLENALDKIHRIIQYLEVFNKSVLHLPIGESDSLTDNEIDISTGDGYVYRAADGTVSLVDNVTVVVSELRELSISFDPGSFYDSDTVVFITAIHANIFPNGIILESWSTSCNIDPNPEMDVNLMYADDFITLANPALVDVLNTTAGASSESVAANINGGAVIPAGKVLYLSFDSDPEGTATEYNFNLNYRGND